MADSIETRLHRTKPSNPLTLVHLDSATPTRCNALGHTRFRQRLLLDGESLRDEEKLLGL